MEKLANKYHVIGTARSRMCEPGRVARAYVEIGHNKTRPIKRDFNISSLPMFLLFYVGLN